VLGYDPNLPPSETVQTATRWLTSVVPAAFLLLAAWLAHGYQLTRARHTEIRAALEARER
jgi:Na+/melibiose symporter-like transporter